MLLERGQFDLPDDVQFAEVPVCNLSPHTE